MMKRGLGGQVTGTKEIFRTNRAYYIYSFARDDNICLLGYNEQKEIANF